MTGTVEFGGIWKKFRRGRRHDSLRDLIPALALRAIGRGSDREEIRQGEFWALRDVSFQVHPGQALGIIGPNGAGKSTALRILTRILRPTRGHYHVEGRIGALIDPSAGFHPDLTGRENVFLQGTIFGMPRTAMRRRFDEIVEYSGIDDFIDMPVKRYSSGMRARLGFSIAVHLDPDVLIVDEVLSIGDLRFQKQAFESIRTMVTSGRPVILVSHQLDQIARLCTRALVLMRGQVVAEGSPGECIAEYTRLSAPGFPSSDDAVPVTLEALELHDSDLVASGERLRFTVRGRVGPEGISQHIDPVTVLVRSAETAEVLFTSSTGHCELQLPERGPFAIAIELQMNVPCGTYLLETCVWDRTEEREISRGPTVHVQVGGGTNFRGSAQLNPRMWLLSDGAARVGA